MKRNKVVLFLVALIYVFSCDNEKTVEPRYANFFIKYHGSDGNQKAEQILQTADGGFIIVGTSSSDKLLDEEEKGTEIVLIKTDAFGNEEWQSTFGRENDDEGIAVEVTRDGLSYYVAGNSINSSGFSDVLVSKVGSQGDLEGEMVIGNSGFDDYVNDLLLLNENDRDGGELILAGSTTYVEGFLGDKTSTNLTDDFDFFYPKLDANLNVIDSWKGYWGFEGTDRAVSIAQDENNDYVICGTSNKIESSDNGKDGSNFYLKTINEFELPGRAGGGTSFGNIDNQNLSEMTSTSNGGQLMVGTTTSGGSSNIFVARANSMNKENGFFKITKIENTEGKAIVEAKGGGYLILGSIIRNANSDVYLIKTDNRGAIIWEQIFGGNNEDIPGDLIQLEDGSIVLTCTITLENQQKIGLIKTNERGELLD